MKKFLLMTGLLTALFAFFGAFSTNAQTGISGNYKFTAKESIDGNPDNYAELFVINIELKEKNQAVMTKTKSEVVEFEKQGSWSWKTEKKLLTVTFPAAKNAQGNTYQKVTMTFRLDGKDLKVVKVVPSSIGKIGDVFIKI